MSGERCTHCRWPKYCLSCRLFLELGSIPSHNLLEKMLNWRKSLQLTFLLYTILGLAFILVKSCFGEEENLILDQKISQRLTNYFIDEKLLYIIQRLFIAFLDIKYNYSIENWVWQCWLSLAGARTLASLVQHAVQPDLLRLYRSGWTHHSTEEEVIF